jgi:hypothetical protein
MVSLASLAACFQIIQPSRVIASSVLNPLRNDSVYDETSSCDLRGDRSRAFVIGSKLQDLIE